MFAHRIHTQSPAPSNGIHAIHATRFLAGAFVVAFIGMSPVRAAAPQQAADSYADMCVKMSTDMGKAHRTILEGDLADNPKLKDYCTCFGAKFAERAMTSGKIMNNKAEIDAAQKEELAMRNSCRTQYGLPPVPAK